MAVLGDASVTDETLASNVTLAPARSPDSEVPADNERPRLPHEPALDGLRGLAVAAVLLFHLERLEGGFLGVDLFFVLSGFLITSLLLVEHRERGVIDLGRFWVRRARRLLPALFVLLVGIAVLLLVFTPADQRPRFRGDALATLGYVANWHRLASDVSYWDIFSQPSPLDHTWSLAIEEQFYVLWPLLVIVVLGRRGGTDVRAVGWVALATAAGSFLLLATTYSPVDTSRAYFGTDTRIGATLLGAGLAAWTIARGPRNHAGIGKPGAASRLLALAGWVGLLWMGWSVLSVDGLSSWYYRGGMATFAVAAALVILAVTSAPGMLGRLVGCAPLRGLGIISYGVYLWHWPVDVYLTPERAGIDGWGLDILRTGVTIALALVSFVAVEQPIRRGTVQGWPLRVAGAGGIAVSVGAVLVATAGVRAPTVDEARGFGPIPVDGSDNPYLLYPSDIPSDALRLLLVGDSGAHNLGPRLAEAGEQANVAIASSAPYHCNVMAPEGVQQLPDGTTMDRGECQARRLALWNDLIDEFDPHAVVYYLANAGSPGKVLIDGEWVYDCDPEFDRYLTEALQQEAELLGRRGALVVFATSPYSRIPDPDANRRIDCRNAVYREVVTSQPSTAIADMNAFVERQADVPEDAVFQDMVHLSVDGGRAVSAWLLPELQALLADRSPRSSLPSALPDPSRTG